MQRAVLVVGRAVVNERHVRLRPHALAQCSGEPRLADARLAHQKDYTTIAVFDLSPPAHEEIKLLLATEKRRRARLMHRFEAVVQLARSEYLAHVHRLGKALDRVRSEIAVFEQLA